MLINSAAVNDEPSIRVANSRWNSGPTPLSVSWLRSSTSDETRNHQQRVWGWAYETLEHHLERGKVTYEVVKHLDSGQVEFVASCQSQRSPGLGPILRLGWLLFGRRTQLRFYRRCGQRLRELVQVSLTGTPVSETVRSPLAIDDLVLVPSGAQPHPLDRLTIRQHNPAQF